MSKPTDLARWAQTTGGVETSNLTVASSEQQDTGWTHGQKPPSGYFNWWMNRVHKWIKYLDGGAFSGASSFDSTLAITGNTTVGGTLGITGNTTVGGTLGVTGLITATAGLTAGSNQHVTVSGTGQFKHGTVTESIPIQL